MKAETSSDLRKRWFRVHMVKAPAGMFVVTIDGLPELHCSAPTPDEALSMSAQALELLEREGAAVPDRGVYSWLEYVTNGLFPMGKMEFSVLPTGQRFLRKGYPTMWDKVSPTKALPLADLGEPIVIPAEEIVWHHVWALSDELTPDERQERILWSGNPALHF